MRCSRGFAAAVLCLLLSGLGCGGAKTPRVAAPGKHRVIVRNGMIETIAPITFESDSDKLTPASQEVLDEVADAIKTVTGSQRVRIEGHCDETGDDAYNLELSRRRALSVKAYLVSHGSIDPGMLETDGHGRAQPIADNANEEGRARNRRVEFILVK